MAGDTLGKYTPRLWRYEMLGARVRNSYASCHTNTGVWLHKIGHLFCRGLSIAGKKEHSVREIVSRRSAQSDCHTW